MPITLAETFLCTSHSVVTPSKDSTGCKRQEPGCEDAVETGACVGVPAPCVGWGHFPLQLTARYGRASVYKDVANV